MTHASELPENTHRNEWTAYERAQSNPRRHFDFDGYSCSYGEGIWPNYLSDMEDLTILSGLTEE